MNIQVPARIQSAINNYRNQGTLGPEAEKAGPEMDMISFIGFRDKTEDLQKLLVLNQGPPDLDSDPQAINCSAEGIQQLDKPYLTTLEAQLEGPAADPDTVLIHKSNGQDKESFEFYFSYNGSPSVVTANVEGAEIAIGASQLKLTNGAPEMTPDGLPKVDSEFLMLK